MPSRSTLWVRRSRRTEKKAVCHQQEQQRQSRPGRDVGGNGVQQGLNISDGEGRQQAPDHGKGHADPAVQVHVGAGIVPEHDPQQLVIEKVHGVFHGGGREAAVKGQAEEAPGQVGGQVQHRQHGQTVHRAQGQQEKALAHLMPGAGAAQTPSPAGIPESYTDKTATANTQPHPPSLSFCPGGGAVIRGEGGKIWISGSSCGSSA